MYFDKEVSAFERRIMPRPCVSWDPWEGCFPISPACKNCRIKNLKLNLNNIKQSQELLDLRVASDQLAYPLVLCSLHTDFFLTETLKFLPEIWQYIKARPFYIFLILTKRPENIKANLPDDWEDGYHNVVFSVTAENRACAKKRIPILLDIPSKHRWIHCTPLLEELDLTEYLKTNKIEHVLTGGEFGDLDLIRPTYFNWFESLSKQCHNYNVRFIVLRCGNKFIKDTIAESFDEVAAYASDYAENLKLNNRIPLKFFLKGTYMSVELTIS